ncbi:kinase-like protein [Rickenella mellea]|uniref:Kinase-like protein n=1 Tax=Rickenella mellea TaxID=50990 RepID=A0A4Y7Q6E3_9AGAM|nr:kinase-like protein [Rickenella mellea]
MQLLDMPELTDTLRRSLARSIAHLARKTGCYPDCLLLDSVEKCGASAIAGGGFADIWQGNMGSVPVALKALRIFKKKPQERALKNFSHEAVVWRQLKHRNILPFLGVFKGSEHFERLCLVSPWMEAGNITEFLDSRPDSDRITLLSDIAEGLNYLHHFTPSVVHGDLKGANIFITPALTACLGDFGLSRFRDFIESTLGSTTGNGTGTVRWQAPELLHNDNDGALVYASQESDMYSFGCVCIEVMTDEPPFAELKRDGAVVLAVSKGQKPQRPTGDCVSRGLNDSLWELMMRCWDDEPNRRPTTEYAVGYFNGCKRNESRRDKISYEYSHVPASLCQYGFPDEHIPNLSCATTSIDDGSIIVP